MPHRKFLRRLVLGLLIGAASAGCGSGDRGITDPPPEGQKPPATPNYVRLWSDAGDYIGGGRSYEYTRAGAVIDVRATGGHLTVVVDGDEWWFGDFESPSGATRLTAGSYGELQRYPFHDPVVGGLDWAGEGRGCNTLSGSFTIDSVAYAAGNLTQVDVRFEQHCEGGAAALHGAIHWRADDPTSPPDPVTPVPAALWKPPAATTPSSVDYVYLESDGGDYIGVGQTYKYTPANSTISVTSELSARPGHVRVNVGPWIADFQAMYTLAKLQPGYYPNLRRFPFHNPARGGLDWSGDGRGCNTLTGWFVVDKVTYSGDVLTALDLRFEQHCEGGAPALHGAIHWTA